MSLKLLMQCMLSPFSHFRLFAILWTVAHQAPLSMGFSSKGYWSGLSCPSPGNLPDSGIKLASLLSCFGRRPLAPPGKSPSPSWQHSIIGELTHTAGQKDSIITRNMDFRGKEILILNLRLPCYFGQVILPQVSVCSSTKWK